MHPDFNPGDPFALFRQFWQAATPPGARASRPPRPEEDPDRKRAELKVVEDWLTMNLGMLHLKVRTLEMQKAARAALKPKE